MGGPEHGWFWWSTAFTKWESAIIYANQRAHALNLRQKVEYRKKQQDWLVRSV